MRKNKKISKTIKYQLTTTISRKTKTETNPDIFLIQLNKYKKRHPNSETKNIKTKKLKNGS